MRGDGVGFCADEAEGVGCAWLGGEVVHFVIEDDACAWDDDFGAEGGVDGGGGGDPPALVVADGEVSGVAAEDVGVEAGRGAVLWDGGGLVHADG